MTRTNLKGGLDLLVEKDSGNIVSITTGKKANSLEFWKRMEVVAGQALAELTLTEDAGER